ncbi:HNH endonuclease [Rothia amarae]|uniref:HNH endonuclease n=1 Tax=Rothia amarae TaxID=169480 RepID=A0A7H2BLV8_9MICC|nr:HNH endonuclease [Rothia amarae]
MPARTSNKHWRKSRHQAIKQAIQEDNFTCHYCNTWLRQEPGYPNSVEYDHVTAWSKVGDNTDKVLSCRTCNRSKGNRTAPKAYTVAKIKPLKVSRQW